jgi:hypothetical protein
MFNVGDVVMLKGGWQDMTVTYSWPDESPPAIDDNHPYLSTKAWETDYFYGKTQVMWHKENGELASGILPTKSLRFVQREEE